MHIDYVISIRSFEQRLSFLPVSKAPTNKFYIFQQCMMYIVFILQCQKAQKNCQIFYRIETSIVLIVSDSVLCDVSALYCCRFLPSLNMNQVPEKLYLGQ